MILTQKKVPINFNLFLFGDIHLGSLLHYRRGLNRMIDMMTSPYDGVSADGNFGVDHGDVIEAIMIDDPRYRPDVCTEPFPQLQSKDAKELLEPLRGKLVLMLDGNHPGKLWRFGNITQDIAIDIGAVYGTYTAKVAWVDHKDQLMFKSYHTHGAKVINSYADDVHRRTSNMELILKRHLQDQAGDTVLMAKGHTHKILVTEPTKRLYMTDDGKHERQAYTKAIQTAQWIPPDHRWYCNTGSFMKSRKVGVSGYAERRELPPVELGFLVAKVRDRELVEVEPKTL